jgi:hypothetical protein
MSVGEPAQIFLGSCLDFVCVGPIKMIHCQKEKNKQLNHEKAMS